MKKNSHTFISTVIILLVIALIPLFSTKTKNRAKPGSVEKQIRYDVGEDRSSSKPPVGSKDWQEQIDTIDSMLATAAKVAKGIPDAERIVRTFTSNALYATVAPGDTIIAIKNQQVPIVPVMVILVFPEQVSYLTHPPRNSVTYEYGKLLFLYERDWVWWVLGLVSLHEMSHWYDIEYTAIEPKNATPTSDAFILGELRAYKLEIMALNKLTNDAWQDAVELVVENDRFTSGTDTPYRTLSREGLADILQTLPSQNLSPQELALLEGVATVHATLVQCKTTKESISAYRVAFLPLH